MRPFLALRTPPRLRASSRSWSVAWRPRAGIARSPWPPFRRIAWLDAGGLAVLLDHLAEYELTDDGRALAITVLRSTGLISRNDNPYRQDPAGPEIAIPNGQMRGPWRTTFALYPHAEGWADGGVPAAAERYRHPFVTSAGGAQDDAAWPPPRPAPMPCDWRATTSSSRRCGGATPSGSRLVSST